jgi:arylformamidase
LGINIQQWIDVTVPILSNMISWPSDPPIKISKYKSIKNGSSSNVSILTLGSHTGTHIDAPRHFFDSGVTIDKMPSDIMSGIAQVIEIKDDSAICVHELKLKKIRYGQCIIFRTRNSKTQWWRKNFSRDFVFLTLAAAKYLLIRRVKMVGIDCLSVGGYGQPDSKTVHRALLSKGIWVIEGLDLTKISSGSYDILCLPLRIYQGDAAPARVLLRPRKSL